MYLQVLWKGPTSNPFTLLSGERRKNSIKNYIVSIWNGYVLQAPEKDRPTRIESVFQCPGTWNDHFSNRKVNADDLKAFLDWADGPPYKTRNEVVEKLRQQVIADLTRRYPPYCTSTSTSSSSSSSNGPSTVDETYWLCSLSKCDKTNSEDFKCKCCKKLFCSEGHAKECDCNIRRISEDSCSLFRCSKTQNEEYMCGTEECGKKFCCSEHLDMCVHKDGAVYLSDTLADSILSDVPAGVVRGLQFAHDNYYCINCRKEWNHCDPKWLWCAKSQENRWKQQQLCTIGCCDEEECKDALSIHGENDEGHEYK